jgi:hypothetical protein
MYSATTNLTIVNGLRGPNKAKINATVRAIAKLLLLFITSLPALAKSHKHFVNILPGSHESMKRQNAEIDRLLLPRIVNAEQLRQLIATGELERITPSVSLRVATGSASQPYARPWTVALLAEISGDFYAQFGAPLTVTSAVRTQEQQRKLRTFNGNAAPVDGDSASSHMAGISIDIGRAGMSTRQTRWLTEYLRGLRDAGRIEVAMERRQMCWHVAAMQR